MANEHEPSKAVSGNGVPLGSRVEMFPSMPLPDLGSVGGPAFVARYQGDANSDLMGILCNSGLLARTDIITSMRSSNHPSLLRLVDNGVVLWPETGNRLYGLAYQRPLAPRMMQSLEDSYPAMSEDAINHYFVTPMVGALLELLRTGVVHNAIRPTNIFWRIGASAPPQLGECLSAPAGYGQPILFETVERAMCTPLGRGVGVHADDCYAFGVTLALLILGQNPLQGLDDKTIITTKMERGSFGALIGNRRLSATHIELMRGLLTDDARQRWTATDLEQWLSGRRLTPKNSDAGRRAARHFDFAGGQYWQPRPLAYALGDHMKEAVTAIESGALDKWLRRSLNDEIRAEDLVDAQTSLKEGGRSANYEDQLVARTSIALDPAAPIRYRGFSIMPAGVAPMLVEAVTTGNCAQAIAEIISSQIITLMIDLQKDLKTEMVPLGQQIERIKGMVEKTSFGGGLNRAAYEMNSDLPCLSPMLRAHYVQNSKSLLPALERVALMPTHPREPMDRHIAAFLIARDRRSESLFNAMTAPEGSSQRGIAMLTLYSEMQYRHGPDALPQLALWLLPLLEGSIRRYLGKSLREKLQKQVREVAERGDLSALLRLLDDPKRIERDQQDFMAARMLYLNIMKEIASIENKLANREIVVQSIGKPMAASISSFLAIVFVMVALMRAVWQGLG